MSSLSEKIELLREILAELEEKEEEQNQLEEGTASYVNDAIRRAIENLNLSTSRYKISVQIIDIEAEEGKETNISWTSEMTI